MSNVLIKNTWYTKRQNTLCLMMVFLACLFVPSVNAQTSCPDVSVSSVTTGILGMQLMNSASADCTNIVDIPDNGLRVFTSSDFCSNGDFYLIGEDGMGLSPYSLTCDNCSSFGGTVITINAGDTANVTARFLLSGGTEPVIYRGQFSRSALDGSGDSTCSMLNGSITGGAFGGDATQPTVSIGALNGQANGTFTAGIILSENSSNFTQADLTATNASATLSGSGSSYTATLTPNSSASISLSVAAATFTDAANNNNIASNTVSATPTPLSVAITAQTNVAINGQATGSATAAASGGIAGYSYLWSNSANTATASGLAAGTYSVTATDANNSTAMTSVTITEPSAVSVAITSQTNVTINGEATGSATAAASGGSGGYSYSWSNGANTATSSGLAAGNYTVTATDSNNATAMTSVTITEPSALSVAITAQTNVAINGEATGSATAAASGGSGGYSYSWSNGANTATSSGLAAGNYTVTATDSNNATAMTSVTITEPSALSVAITAQTNVAINGEATGSATAAASGGSGGYSYSWSNGANTATSSGLAAGNYTVTATDSNNATAMTSVTITEPYNVSGSVTGLIGSITISNNGSDIVVIDSGSQDFMFPDQNDGSSYAVTTTDSATQSCSVSANGTGVISGANVTGVMVSCSTNSYGVSGSVTGLVGSITLTNNGTDDIVITDSGPQDFMFPDQNDGSSYSVETTDSATQSCSVSANGTGILAGDDITNVVVSCAVNTYNVSGSVIGLIGSITLSNNGGDDIVITDSGTQDFTFPDQNDGAAYSVTTTDSDSQVCSVVNASGVIAGSDVTDVVVNCEIIVIELNITSLNFGNVSIGENESRVITVTNTGNVSATLLGIDNLGSPFILTGGSCTAFPFELMPSSSCEIEILFEPTTDGNFSTEFGLTSDAASSPNLINVSGTSVMGQGPAPTQVPTINWLGLLVLVSMILMIFKKRQTKQHKF